MRLFALTLFLTVALPSATIAQAKVTRVDYVFLIDVSASMVGQAGHTNIFPSVKKTIQEFVSQIQPGSRVLLFPFAEKTLGVKTFEVNSVQDANAIQAYVDALNAGGQATAIFNSVEEVLRTVDLMRQQEKEQRPVVFFVYTDGDDNVSKGWTLSSILNHFNLKRGKDDWLFYTELGLPRDPNKEAQFKKFERMQYVQERAGNVHPIIQVETVIPLLNFGNLKQTPRTTRIEKFIVRAKDSLPTNYTVTIEPEFANLKSQGAYADVSPHTFYPAENVNLDFSLVNSQGMKEGNYTGRFHLVSSDPLVIVVPDEIEVGFLFEPERIVQIVPASGGVFPLSLGDQKLARDEVIESKKTFLLRFNLQAEQAGEKMKVRVTENDANPQHLDLGTDLSILQIHGSEGLVGSEVKQLVFVFRGKSDLSAGSYSGQIVFEGQNLRIEGAGLDDVKGNPQAKSLSWSFHLASPPWTWWVWMLAVVATLLCLLLLAYTAYCLKEGVGPIEGVESLSATWFPVLEGELEVLEPEAKQDTHSLRGRKEVKVGAGGDILAEIDGGFRMELATYLGRRVIKITASEDSVVKVDGSPIFTEHIFDGQLIEFGKVVRAKIRYNNIRLPKPD
ncbi:MAG: VWA domain-containing protein [Ignavibacteriales bacterium]|nr:VWA domain-containing protein [Ignavibacteriales bacterium]